MSTERREFGPVQISKLVLTPFITDEKITHDLFTCPMEGKTWFYKQPSSSLADEAAKKFRILNEAISGVIALILSKKGKSFSTPQHRLVIDASQNPMGVLSEGITLERFDDNKLAMIKALTTSGLAEITALSFFMKDPDAYNNIGHGESTTSPLARIDWGLSGYPTLEAMAYLTKGEENKLPSDKGAKIFDITPTNILSFVMQPVTEIECHAHHVFTSASIKYLATFCASTKESESKLATDFFQKIFDTFHLITKELTSEDFKRKIHDELGLGCLSDHDKMICDQIIDQYIDSANLLSTTLKELSSKDSKGMEEIIAGVKADIGPESSSPEVLSRLSPYRSPSGSDADDHPPALGGGGGGGGPLYDPALYRNSRSEPKTEPKTGPST
ncbi:MAG: hypothetical protein NTW94_01345 [Legionellales bacterium]|nr:hypothetical protein [Legionellales bacterium]